MKQVEHVSPREGYDRWARVYDGDGNPLLPLDEAVVEGVLGDVRGLSVLELACGTGRHTIKLAAAGAHVTAVDFSSEMLAVAKERTNAYAIAFSVADLREPLSFANDGFDVALCCLALEHLEDLAPLFAEVHRVLRPGGSFVCSDMHPAMRLRGNQANFDDPKTGTEVRLAGYEHPVSEYVMTALAAGFHIDRIEEHKGDDALAAKWPRAKKYVGWPMLVALRALKP